MLLIVALAPVLMFVVSTVMLRNLLGHGCLLTIPHGFVLWVVYAITDAVAARSSAPCDASANDCSDAFANGFYEWLGLVALEIVVLVAAAYLSDRRSR